MTGGAAERLKAITPPGMLAHVSLTMTDEFPYAQAMVMISGVPLPAALGFPSGGRGGLP
jgi:holo-[acyl-carrier protein] synthase